MARYLLVQIFKAEQESSVAKPFKQTKLQWGQKLLEFIYQQQDVKKV